MKNKKLVIIISALVMIVAIASITLWLLFKDQNENNKTESTFTAYVDINPLIKLNFKVTCDKDNNCSNPLVTDSELINEDAKTIYKDLVLKDKSLSETIELLANTVKNNDITFTEIHIYSNYDNEDAFKVDSIDYEIVLDVKEDKELEQIINELIIEEANKKTKEILVPLTYPKSLYDRGLGPTNLKPLEHEELFVTEYRTIAESDNENIPSLRTPEKYVKVMVQGPAEIIDTLPDKYALNDEYEHLIYALIDATGLDKGTHTLPMEFHIMKLEDVEVITPSIKCQFEIVAKEDMPFPLEGY